VPDPRIVVLIAPGDLPSIDELLRRPIRHKYAACRGIGSGAFIVERARASAAAKTVCSVCPVRRECLAFALEDPQLQGVWGGTTARERAAMRRASA
jgi:hypothetical protein